VTPETKEFVVDVLEAFGNKVKRTLADPHRYLRGEEAEQVRNVLVRCNSALEEVSKL
jgi:hypothetical protein